MAGTNDNTPREISYNFTEYGVRVDMPENLRHVSINAKSLPSIYEYDYDPNILRTVLNYEFIGNTDQDTIDPSNPIKLIIYLTPEDLYFAQKDINKIKIYDWKPNEGIWAEKNIVDRESITPSPPPWSKAAYIGYVIIEIKDWSDPPVAVGR
jgi:hypothetical protein